MYGTERSALSGDVTVRHRTERALSEDEFKSYNAKKEINQVQSEERDKSPS